MVKLPVEEYERLIAAFQQIEQAKQELAQHLSPENQNVINGDLIGMARDLAQIKVTSMNNAQEALRQLEQNKRDFDERIVTNGREQYRRGFDDANS